MFITGYIYHFSYLNKKLLNKYSDEQAAYYKNLVEIILKY
jgi:hypothetical protein